VHGLLEVYHVVARCCTLHCGEGRARCEPWGAAPSHSTDWAVEHSPLGSPYIWPFAFIIPAPAICQTPHYLAPIGPGPGPCATRFVTQSLCSVLSSSGLAIISDTCSSGWGHAGRAGISNSTRAVSSTSLGRDSYSAPYVITEGIFKSPPTTNTRMIRTIIVRQCPKAI